MKAKNPEWLANNAEVDFKAKKAEALKNLAKLALVIKDYGKKDKVHYGHCGSISKANADIRHLTGFLTNSLP